MKQLIQLHAIFQGRVQGVFFRQHAKDYADQLNILGYVKNLKDGTVEMIAISDKENLEKFLKIILEKPGFGSIDRVQKKYSSPTKSYDSFDILY